MREQLDIESSAFVDISGIAAPRHVNNTGRLS